MAVTGYITELAGLAEGSHACWIVGDQTAFRELAAVVLAEGRNRGQKAVVFGPEASAALAELRGSAAMAADPYVAFLDRRVLEPEAMFAVFRAQSEVARAEGFSGLCVVADMDWLLPTQPSTDEIIGFEVLLDRVVAEVGATVICAYRRASFDAHAILGALCVHPTRYGHDGEPQFCLVAGNAGSWRLSGEVDRAVLPAFAAALAPTAVACCVVDVTQLDFIDVGGMRTIAEAAAAGGVTVQLRGARPALRRNWQLAGFHEFSSTVELVA